MRADTVYIVVHYMDIKATERCIRSIFECSGDDFHVVIVDNGSKAGHRTVLIQKFSSDPSITYIDAGTDLGYASAVNRAYGFIRSEMEAETLVVMHNDMELNTHGFGMKARRILEEKDAPVLGPDIISKRTGYHENPYMKGPRTLAELKGMYERYAYVNRAFRRYYVKYDLGRRKAYKPNPFSVSEGEDMMLCTGCLILSKRFMEKMDHVFKGCSHMYMEEDAFATEMRDKGIMTLYDPSLRVTHEGGSSMKKRYLLPYLREKKKWKEKEKALGELIEALEPERKDEEICSV
ncbi:MAG: glycosyltransferase family 2 protein [Clostridia bacterium]|nr:glycosyltransferase family 2 protein [Clostridia bacterium]